MPTPGRNEPCHCGSGKKYKKCCLARDQEAAHGKQAAAVQVTAAASQSWVLAEDDLDRLSNSIIHLIDERRFDDAERARDQLRERFPDVIDSIERTAMIEQARGNLPAAIEWWRKTLNFMLLDDGFDDEGRQAVRDIITKLERQVAPNAPTP